jgi:hypothetical protein
MKHSMQRSRLASELRRVYRSAPDQAEEAIEAHLQDRLQGLPMKDRALLLQLLMAEFSESRQANPPEIQTEEEILSQVFSLLLGRDVAHLDLPPAELLKRLAASLNTVFDSLNRLIGAIQSTLIRSEGSEETIRHAIGEHLEGGEDRLKLLEEHIGQINRAFLLTQQAFKTAAERIVCKMLQELAPATIGKEPPKGLHFKPFRKAGFFEIYEQKFQQCQEWFDSGRFMKDLMREFERVCENRTAF